jgi:hypothetical protein
LLNAFTLQVVRRSEGFVTSHPEFDPDAIGRVATPALVQGSLQTVSCDIRPLAPVGDRRRYATGVQIKKASARDHKIFLSKRLREFSKGQPELLELRRILLKLGGEELIPPPDHDPVTNFLIDFGIVFAGPIVLKQSGRQRGGALGRIWIRRLYGIVGIGIGYALEEDGLWREHTFGVLREGILETIAPKRKYFGLLLISEAADRLAETLNK